jgi:hypothetical protein
MDAVVWPMEYYQESLIGRRFIPYINHKPLETLGALHIQTMNRPQLAIINFDFEIWKCRNASRVFVSEFCQY